MTILQSTEATIYQLEDIKINSTRSYVLILDVYCDRNDWRVSYHHQGIMLTPHM